MKTIKFMAEIEWLAPDGFDVRKIVDFRPPKKGERFLTAFGGIVEVLGGMEAGDCRPIIDDWEWPEWLTEAAAVVMLPGSDWVATEHVPMCVNGVWRGTGRVSSLCFASFAPPPCDDWRKSRRINPRFQNGGGSAEIHDLG